MPTLPVALPTPISSMSACLTRSAAPSKPPSVRTTTLRDLVGRGEQPAGQGHGLGDPGRAVAGGDRVERLAEGPLVVGQPAEDLRLGARGDDRQLVAQPQAVDHPPALGLRRFEPARRDVGRVHARRVVHDQDHPSRPRLLPAEDRVGQGEDQQGQERELEQQRDQVPQPLPDRPRLLLLEDLPPEHQGRDRHPAQPDLQDVEDDDRHRQGGEQRGRPG